MLSITNLVKKLEGLQTVDTIQKKLNISRATAIKYAYLLNKRGFVEKSGGGKQPRFYRIGILNRQRGNPGMYDMINKYSPIKLWAPAERIIGRELSVEETLVRAIGSKDFRTILASLALFNRIKNWSLLYKLAKENNARKKVGALYDVARRIIKTRRMDNRTYNKLLQAKEKDEFIIEGIRSKTYENIENKWKIHIPFNKADLMRYKE